MRVVGLESSCDESAVAVLDEHAGLLAHRIFSQTALHNEFGGVVPELASRDHTRRLLPLLEAVMAEAGTTASDIDGIAYTAGPGLVGALLAGATLGRSLAYAWGVQAIGVHHLEAHLLAPFLEQSALSPPFLALLVSGGHTMLVAVEALGRYKVLGETLDDAAGEAFDKTAKLLGLPYPGGPHLAALADKGRPSSIHLPRPMLDRPGLDFSFSGLKTAAQLALRQGEATEQRRADLAWAFQHAIVSTLVSKTSRALAATGLKQLVVVGGVGANRRLRESMRHMAGRSGVEVFYPRVEFCTDNAAMVALAGLWRLRAGNYEDLAICVRPRWALTTLDVKMALREE